MNQDDITRFMNRTGRRPWDHIHLTKEERKGKTFEEMQEMRKIKWGRNERDDSTIMLPINKEEKSE